jgi:hypothetical protein
MDMEINEREVAVSDRAAVARDAAAREGCFPQRMHKVQQN